MPRCDFLRAPVVWRRGCCAKRVQNGVIKKRPFDGLRSPRCVFRRGEKVARPTLPRQAGSRLPRPVIGLLGVCCTSLADARMLNRKGWRWRGFGEDGWRGWGAFAAFAGRTLSGKTGGELAAAFFVSCDEDWRRGGREVGDGGGRRNPVRVCPACLPVCLPSF